MLRKARLATAIATFVLAIGSALAQVPVEDLHVLAWAGRGGFDDPEGFVQVWNSGHHYFKVSIERIFFKPSAPCSWCPAFTHSCGVLTQAPPESGGYLCEETSSTGSTPLIVEPCDSSEFCQHVTDCMPTDDSQGHGRCRSLSGTICATYRHVRVKVVEYKATANDSWEPVDEVVCVTNAPVGCTDAPACPTARYCDGQTSGTPCSDVPSEHCSQ